MKTKGFKIKKTLRDGKKGFKIKINSEIEKKQEPITIKGSKIGDRREGGRWGVDVGGGGSGGG